MKIGLKKRRREEEKKKVSWGRAKEGDTGSLEGKVFPPNVRLESKEFGGKRALEN
jgi:hypothetical protein